MLGALALFALVSGPARAQQPTQDVQPPPLEAPKPVAKAPTDQIYPVGALHLEYAYTVQGVPDLASIAQLSVPLVRGPDGFRAPAKDETHTEPVSLNRPEGTPPAPFTASAIRAIDQAIADEFSRQGIVGVIVRPDPQDIGANTGRDLRPPERTALRLVVLVNRVAEMHTIASGWRGDENERIDNPAHARILENSPVQVGDRVDREALDDYVDFLNRHPARWVDMTLGASGMPGGARLDYLVAEGKPWTAYFQASNTGTDQTSDWRQRFGFTHNQVTNRDDILQLDYITGDFDSVNAFYGSYDSPIPFPWLLRPDRVRAAVDGQWSEYDASDVGIENSEFQGSQWIFGGRVKANVFQYRDLFVDVFTGAHYEHYDADSKPVEGVREHGNVNFFFPEVGAALERRTEISSLFASVSGKFAVPDLGDADSDELAQMGRTGVHEESVNLLRWEASTSFFMVPFFFPVKEPDSSLSASDLSNEVFLSFRGQYTNDRLIPAMQEVAGGMETVRGWPQSFIAADSLYLVRAEYRVHLPRLLPIREPFELPWYGKFRAAPDGPSGRPDWDLIAFTFYDWARVEVNGDLSQDEQNDETLSGTGLGLELQLPGHLIVGMDYGWSLTQVMGRDKFSDKFNISIALVY
jgi:hypothetical protein